MSTVAANPWYREPWVWFNLILLSAAIISASVMSVIAIQHTPAEIGSRWYQEGVLAKRERQQALLMHHLQLEGKLSIAQNGELNLKVSYDTKNANAETIIQIDAQSLQLYIEHPTDPTFDQVITLRRYAPSQYRGRLQASLNGKRRLLISPTSDRWYLTSQAYFPASTITFQDDLS